MQPCLYDLSCTEKSKVIDLKTRMLTQGEKSEPVIRFELWWRGPGGLYIGLQEAVTFCTDNDYDPNLCVQPAPVAISNTLTEELR